MQKSIRVMQCFQINEARSYKNKNYTTEKHVAKNMKSQETHCSLNKFEIKKQRSFTPPILTFQPQKYVPAVISIVDKWHGDCPGGKEGGKIVLNRSRNYWKLISGQRTRTNIHWEGKLKTDPVVQRCLTFVC